MLSRAACLAAALGLLTACQTTTADVSRAPGSADAPVVAVSGGAALNAYRRQHGLPPLREHSALTAAAREQARFMAETGAQTHAGRGGSTVGQRVRGAGCSFLWAAENIAWGHRSDASAMDWWMTSPGHRANALSRNPTHYGWATVGTQRALVLASGC